MTRNMVQTKTLTSFWTCVLTWNRFAITFSLVLISTLDVTKLIKMKKDSPVWFIHRVWFTRIPHTKPRTSHTSYQPTGTNRPYLSYEEEYQNFHLKFVITKTLTFFLCSSTKQPIWYAWRPVNRPRTVTNLELLFFYDRLKEISETMNFA